MSRTLEHEKLKREAPSHAETMAAAQDTTNAYAIVPESLLDTTGHDNVEYILEETGGANDVDAKIMGRVKSIKDGAITWSPWVDAAGASAAATGISASATQELKPSSVPFDQTAVFVKANVADSQGAGKVYGLSKKLA